MPTSRQTRIRPMWGYGPWTGWNLRPLGHCCGPWLFGPPCWAYYAGLLSEKQRVDAEHLNEYIADRKAEWNAAEKQLGHLKGMEEK